MDDGQSMPTLQAWLQQSMASHGHQDALECGDVRWSYHQLREAAERVVSGIDDQAHQAQVVGVLGYRSAAKYAAVAGVVLSGRTYLPLHTTLSPEHTARMIALAGCQLLLVCPESVDALESLRPLLADDVKVLLVDGAAGGNDPTVSLNGRAPFVARRNAAADEVAYLLYTVDSTEVGKGVEMRHKTVGPYVRTIQNRYGIGPSDRCSQMLDLTFDGSVHDIFVAWTSGACLHVPAEECTLARASALAIAG
jgi:non-ribosomal peptide synthetase component F